MARMSLISEYQKELERLMAATDDTLRLLKVMRKFDEKEEVREQKSGPRPNFSKYAKPHKVTYDKSDRTADVFGLIIHTTGSGAPDNADKEGISVLEWCARRYSKSYGCHYVNGHKGAEGGELILVGRENEKPHTVGMTEQNTSIRAGRWKKDISATTLKYWEKNWGHAYSNANNLFPGNSANNVYIGMEMPPVTWWNKRKKKTIVSAKPMREGLKFTRAQHDTCILLAIDIAERHNLPDGWWLTPRIIGHEELSPISRSQKTGGWDPGWLRAKPYFDFGYVRDEIARIIG
jgi:hypothetical protein